MAYTGLCTFKDSGRYAAVGVSDDVMLTESNARTGRKDTIRRGVVIALLSVFLAGLMLTIVLDNRFYYTRPRHAEPETGRVYARAIHGGTVVYLTRIEALPWDYPYVIFVAFVLAGVLNQRWRCFPPSKR